MRRFRIGISIVLLSLLTGCGNSTNISEELPQTEVDSSDIDSENIVGELDSDDIAGEETETAEQEAYAEQADDIAEETAGADGSDDEEILYLKPCASYQDILDNAYEVIIADVMTDIVLGDELFSTIGIREAKIGRDTNEALAAIGYTFYDVEGNGIEELIIADTGGGVWNNNRIMLMYTLYDDKPVLLIDGWARNSYHLLNDGTIFHEGSSGAAYTDYGIYRIAEDGNSLEVIFYLYSGYYGDSVSGWFYNTTGEQTYDESEIVEFEDEGVPWNRMEDYITQVKELELTFFAEFKENQ